MKAFRKKLQTYIHQGPLFLVFVYLLTSTGISSLVAGATSQISPGRPSPGSTLSVTSNTNKPNTVEATMRSLLAPSIPLSIDLPSINVHSDIIQVGKNTNGTAEVPSGADYDKAAWYRNSVTPGEHGSSVILGHVDSALNGESVFFNLGALQLDSEIFIKRADGSTVKFKVESVKEYAKGNFPTTEVYGGTNGSTLELITCNGEFDQQSGQYESNTIVSALLVSK